LEIKSLKPEDKKLNNNNNPPKLILEFFPEQKNIDKINCYSNDGGNWKKSNLNFKSNTMTINFEEPFIPRRGRINCSLNEKRPKAIPLFQTKFKLRNDVMGILKLSSEFDNPKMKYLLNLSKIKIVLAI